MTSNHIPQRAIGAKKNHPCAQGMAAKEARAIGKYITDAGGGNQYFIDDSDISKLKADEKIFKFPRP
jgi:hypothetical protein